MGHRRKALPRGIDLIAEVIGEVAALELVLWRWARSCENRLETLPRYIDDPWARRMAAPDLLPREVSIFVPRRPSALSTLPRHKAAALSAKLGGETVVARVPDWLLGHYLNRAGLRAMCDEGIPATEVARQFGRTASVWRKLFAKPPRPSPLDSVNENIQHEVVLFMLMRRPLRTRKSGM